MHDHAELGQGWPAEVVSLSQRQGLGEIWQPRGPFWQDGGRQSLPVLAASSRGKVGSSRSAQLHGTGGSQTVGHSGKGEGKEGEGEGRGGGGEGRGEGGVGEEGRGGEREEREGRGRRGGVGRGGVGKGRGGKGEGREGVGRGGVGRGGEGDQLNCKKCDMAG